MDVCAMHISRAVPSYHRILEEIPMKKLLALTLALMMVVALAACGESNAHAASEPASTPPATSTPAAPDPAPSGEDSPDSTAAATPTATNAGLPDGYKLEVEQTGEKSGIVRLTDPNLKPEYPATNNSASNDMPIYEWTFMLGDTWYISTSYMSGDMGDEPSVTIENMSNDLYNIADNQFTWLDFIVPSIEGNTLVYQFEIPAGYDFSWAAIDPYEVTIINAVDSIEIYATIAAADAVTISLEGATQTPYISSTPAPASVPDSSSAPQTPVGGTIPMPDGFESNPGDAEYFKPKTDDYIYRKTIIDDKTSYYDLISFDETGSIVQYMYKRIYETNEKIDANTLSFMYSGTPEGGYAPYTVQVGNVLYIDFYAADGGYSQDGYRDVNGEQKSNRVAYSGLPSSRSLYESDYKGGLANRSDYYISKP
jgi:hypothetical protein